MENNSVKWNKTDTLVTATSLDEESQCIVNGLRKFCTPMKAILSTQGLQDRKMRGQLILKAKSGTPK